jgi:Flp pilus assembly protein TadG
VKQDGPKQDQAVTPEPTAASLPKNQNIPEQPSQGAVAAALNPVMGAAKACVAGADDVSRASVTFASSGGVTSVSVSGWAAAHGKSGCVQAALKGAKTQPFSKPSFTVGVPIRP